MSSLLPVTPWAALVLGLVTSLHCVGMCGPLACATGTFSNSKMFRWDILSYHGGRFFSYAVAGMVLGGFGEVAAGWFSSAPAQWLPGFMILAFLLMALGWEQKIPKLLIFQKLMGPFYDRIRGHSSWIRLGGLGLVTPLLPCGPLYLVFGAAALSGSWRAGGFLMTMFVLGTIPLYAGLNLWIVRLGGIFSPRILQWSRQGIALLSVLLLVWRVLPSHGEGIVVTECPFHGR